MGVFLLKGLLKKKYFRNIQGGTDFPYSLKDGASPFLCYDLKYTLGQRLLHTTGSDFILPSHLAKISELSAFSLMLEVLFFFLK